VGGISGTFAAFTGTPGTARTHSAINAANKNENVFFIQTTYAYSNEKKYIFLNTEFVNNEFLLFRARAILLSAVRAVLFNK
jgi:hypothetical protein